MIVLEDVLRETFAARVAGAPAPHDPAAAAIRRARGIQRRRRAVSGAGATVVAMVLAGTLLWVQDWRSGFGSGRYSGVDGPIVTASPPGEPTAPAPGRQPGVDLFANGRVWTADGRRVTIAEPGWEVVRAFRVPAGWLLGGRTEARLVSTENVAVPLPLAGQWALSADGSRMAYTADGTLRVARLSRDGLQEVGSVEVPTGVMPVAFAGERVVLGVFDGTGRLAKIDHWRPGEPYRPVWTQLASRVYEAPGSEVLAQVPAQAGGPDCLARVAVSEGGTLHADRSAACEIEPVGGSWPAGVVSPDGRWLAMPGPSRVDLYDLSTVFARPAVAHSCTASATASLVWESTTAVLAAGGSEVVRCTTEGTSERARLPADLPAEWRLVPYRPLSSGR